MTPLEKALQNEGEIEYCDECEFIRLVRLVPYCGVSGKLIHPIMYDRSIPGNGPARGCKRRREAIQNVVAGKRDKSGAFPRPGQEGESSVAIKEMTKQEARDYFADETAKRTCFGRRYQAYNLAIKALDRELEADRVAGAALAAILNQSGGDDV